MEDQKLRISFDLFFCRFYLSLSPPSLASPIPLSPASLIPLSLTFSSIRFSPASLTFSYIRSISSVALLLLHQAVNVSLSPDLHNPLFLNTVNRRPIHRWEIDVHGVEMTVKTRDERRHR